MIRQIDPTKIIKGDVILTGVDAFKESLPIKFGNILRFRWKSIKWTHAAVSIGGLDIIESIPDPGVTKQNLQSKYIDSGIDILVLRCKIINQKAREAAADYCVSKIKESSKYDPRALSYFMLHFMLPTTLGNLVDFNPIGRSIFEKFINDEDAYFCSELVAEALRFAGAQFMKQLKPWQIMPVDFYDLKLFNKIDDIWLV